MLASFDSTHDAMRAEQVGKAAGLKVRLIPTPETVRAGCGLSLRMPPETAPAVALMLEENGVKVSHWTLSATIDGSRQFLKKKSPLASKEKNNDLPG